MKLTRNGDLSCPERVRFAFDQMQTAVSDSQTILTKMMMFDSHLSGY